MFIAAILIGLYVLRLIKILVLDFAHVRLRENSKIIYFSNWPYFLRNGGIYMRGRLFSRQLFTFCLPIVEGKEKQNFVVLRV